MRNDGTNWNILAFWNPDPHPQQQVHIDTESLQPMLVTAAEATTRLGPVAAEGGVARPFHNTREYHQKKRIAGRTSQIADHPAGFGGRSQSTSWDT